MQKQGMFVLRGKIDSDEWSGWFYLDTAGLLALTVDAVWALVGFLVQLCGASFVIDSGLDDYDGGAPDRAIATNACETAFAGIPIVEASVLACDHA